MPDYQIKHIYIDNQLIMYKLFYWSKYNLTMRVNRKDQSIHVYVNKHLPINMIDDFIKKHIIKQYRHLQKSTTNKRIDINHLYLLNEKYSLQIIPITTKRKYEIYQNKIYLQCKKTTDKIILVKQLLLDYCERFIRPLFLKWVKKMKLSNVSLNFRWMVSRYGVCHTNKPYKVILALQSITYRIPVIEYLIVHELVHIFHPHHQNQFWQCVENYIPNWKELDKELLENNLGYSED